MKKRFDAKTLAGVGILTAVVIALQLFSNYIPIFGISPTLALVPIVVGASLYGVWAGTWLGFVFSVIALIAPSTAVFFDHNPIATIVIVIAKGTLAGIAAALIYRAISGKNQLLAVVLAAIACPIVNTGIFTLGANWFFRDVFSVGNEATFWVFFGVLMGIICLNFLVEFLIDLILSPTIVQIIRIGKRGK